MKGSKIKRRTIKREENMTESKNKNKKRNKKRKKIQQIKRKNVYLNKWIIFKKQFFREEIKQIYENKK